MAVFATADEVYARIGGVIEAMLADPLLACQFQRADCVVQYRFREPEARITVDLRAAGEAVAEFGEPTRAPDVVLEMAADTAHRFFLGEVNVAVALARREIVAEGPVAKILKLVPLVKPFFGPYREQQRELVTA